MKILIAATAFHPSVGGYEMAVSILAHEFVRNNCEVIVVTTTLNGAPDEFPFVVVRQPTIRQLWDLTRWCEVFFQVNVSIKGLWPLLFIHRPYVISHQGWYCRTNGKVGWQDRMKYLITHFAVNISVSHALAAQIPGRQLTVIPNPYRDDIFYRMAEVTNKKDLVFLGRLVSDKGADILLCALAKLKDWNKFPQLTVIGSGPELENLQRLCQKLDIENQVEFVGKKLGRDLAKLLNQHKIMVIPTRCREGFGIVALEGIACGCVVVGSDGGGLEDAIGPCGVLSPNNNSDELTNTLCQLLQDDDQISEYQRNSAQHLAQHTPTQIVKAYLQIFEKAVK